MSLENVTAGKGTPPRIPLVWDNHGCMPTTADRGFLPQLERYRDAGVHVVSINVGSAETHWQNSVLTLSSMRQWIAERPDRYCLIATIDDIERSKAERKLGVVFDIEGMGVVLEKLSLVQTFYELGVRWMLVAYNHPNNAGGGCLGEDLGLTDLGRKAIDEMERVGMVLCLSHTGERTAKEALEYTRNPVIFSHSNPYGCTPHARNISDDLLRACARTGGVVGINGIGPFLGAKDCLVDRFIRHVRYAIDLIGPDHVGISLDYVFDLSGFAEKIEKSPGLFPGDVTADLQMIAPERIAAIMEELGRVNLTDTQVEGVLGLNWYRVAKQVWR